MHNSYIAILLGRKAMKTNKLFFIWSVELEQDSPLNF